MSELFRLEHSMKLTFAACLVEGKVSDDGLLKVIGQCTKILETRKKLRGQSL